MDASKTLHLLDLLVTALLVLVPSIATAITPHPSQVASPALAMFLRILGRLSLLRHGSSPGTLHLPLSAQPSPRETMRLPKDAESAIEVAFWEFDTERKKTGVERDAFKGQARALLRSCGPLALVLLLLGAGASCTPAERAAAAQGARTAIKATLDLLRCELAGGGSPLVKTVAAELAADPAARERYRSALVQGAGLRIGGVTVGAQDAACLLAMVASVLPQQGWPRDQGLGSLIVRRAEVCDTGGCERPEDRAAQLLRDLWRAGVVRLPPSGEG